MIEQPFGSPGHRGIACLLVLIAIAAVAPAQARRGPVFKLAGEMTFTEGPVWLAKDRKLVFSDIPASKLMQWSEASGLSVFRDARNPNGNAVDLRGRLITCEHGSRTMIRHESDGEVTVLASHHEGKRLNSPNDVAVHPDGSLWFTDPPWGLERGTEGKELPGHWVFRRDPETGETTAVLTDLAMPNGIAFSPDGKVLYVSDTGGHRSHPTLEKLAPSVRAYVVEGAGVGAQKWTTDSVGSDGMCVDVEGNLYTTTGEGVIVWGEDGTRRGVIEVPEHPANVCFGGDDFDRLFITARTSLYAVDMKVKGHRPAAAGVVVAVGGGGTTDAIKARVLELAGGDATVLVFPQASERRQTGPDSAKMWKRAGARKAIVATSLQTKKLIAQIDAADVLWFCGGSQTRLMEQLDEAAGAAVRRRLRRGAVVGGTSAGAAVLGPLMITGEARTRSIVGGGTPLLGGLGLADDVIVDQHFAARRRFNRLLVAVGENRKYVGLGVDERTAAFIRGADVEVVGDGTVTIVDARAARVSSQGAGEPLALEGVTVGVLTDGGRADISPSHSR